ncbi:uncharacterized protein SOCG_02769 [Schizosaccharomyces octosporus yFS286]|uniref:Uncharacterized protein n=1 Tax=Schizosaccharomyces octosporus (strain yFS286) TaxID=483514 RepID=S9Q015_SCHOY|nr:uncharacterized protein SOCG_02769 [Schizosaccharomyces octosporus yFS286]EPX73547.1 hypothetical protein SOCG_02769 [Schizosaccharomyces octosporus yFS286]
MSQLSGIQSEAFTNKVQKPDKPPVGYSASVPLERDWFLGIDNKSQNKKSKPDVDLSSTDTNGSSLPKLNSDVDIADRLSERRKESLRFDGRKKEKTPKLLEAEEYNTLRRHRDPNRMKMFVKAFLLSLYTPGQIGIVSFLLQYLQCTKSLFLFFFISSLFVGIARLYTQYQMLQDEFWEEAAKEHPNIAKLVNLGGIEALSHDVSQFHTSERQNFEKKND